jgi:beta-lactamase superfamily II metal-dependent hydrolase
MMKWAGMAGACAALWVAGTAAAAAEKPLRLAVIDVEGGSAILFVTPEGASLLVDTGWPKAFAPMAAATQGGDPPSSAQQIVRAAKAMGVSKIDHLLITHYHLDHVGGVPDLMAAIPVGEVIDHGPNREHLAPEAVGTTRAAAAPDTLYPLYEAAIRGHPRRTGRPGEQLKIGSLTLTFVSGDGDLLDHPSPGAGGATPGCADFQIETQSGGEENPRSLGFVATYGKARIVTLGDLTKSKEQGLVCPVNKLGHADLWLVSHHGSELSNSGALAAALAPPVAIVGNGARKGGDASVLATLAAAPSKPVVWQLHGAVKAPEANRPAAFIANPDAAKDLGFSLEAQVCKGGGIRVTNPRTGYSEAYGRPDCGR